MRLNWPPSLGCCRLSWCRLLVIFAATSPHLPTVGSAAADDVAVVPDLPIPLPPVDRKWSTRVPTSHALTNLPTLAPADPTDVVAVVPELTLPPVGRKWPARISPPLPPPTTIFQPPVQPGAPLAAVRPAAPVCCLHARPPLALSVLWLGTHARHALDPALARIRRRSLSYARVHTRTSCLAGNRDDFDRHHGWQSQRFYTCRTCFGEGETRKSSRHLGIVD